MDKDDIVTTKQHCLTFSSNKDVTIYLGGLTFVDLSYLISHRAGHEIDGQIRRALVDMFWGQETIAHGPNVVFCLWNTVKYIYLPIVHDFFVPQ